MKWINLLLIAIIFFACQAIPVSSQPDEESLFKEISNISITVPTPCPDTSDPNERMNNYQNWIEDCALQISLFSDKVLSIFGMTEMNWYSPHPDAASNPVTKAPTIPTQTRAIPESWRFNTAGTMTGQSGKQSAKIFIPAGYWELWYTVDPVITGGQDSHSATGENSALFPVFSIKVSDAATGEFIETIEPPGGLDITLWQRAGDPRPWIQKFYRGNKEYVFDVTAKHVKSYTIEVRIRKE